MELSRAEFRQLLAFRTELRNFLHWSADRAREEGLTPAQHQLLLVVVGHGNPKGPTIGEAAEYLLLRHHSVVELAARAESAGLIKRTADPLDHRVVRLLLTEAGHARIEALAASHLEELQRLAPLFRRLTAAEPRTPDTSPTRRATGTNESAPTTQ